MTNISLPKMHCPRCNHPQKFGSRKRQVSEDFLEVYIMCKKCKWTKVITSGNSDKISKERELERLRIRSQKDPKLRELYIKKLLQNE